MCPLFRGFTVVSKCLNNTIIAFRWTKISPNPGTDFCVVEIFDGINFRQYGKDCHMLNVIVNTGQKFVKQISPTRSDGEIDENFLLAKISGYTVTFAINAASSYDSCVLNSLHCPHSH